LLSSISASLSGNSYTVSYSYDALQRMIGRAIDGVNSSVSYDALGRTTVITNTLGSFANSYVGVTPLLASVSYPNGQATQFAYFGTTNDERLAEISNSTPSGANLSTFNYTYDAQGNIQTWTQQADANTPQVYNYTYDHANQLISAVLQTAGGSPTVLKQFAYLYDMAGNRTSEQTGGSSPSQTTLNSSGFNNLNQKTSESPGGIMQVQGSLNGEADVTVNGNAASVSTNLTFTGSVSNTMASMAGTSNAISVVATYATGTVTNNYGVIVTGTTNQTLVYDADGNLLSDGSGKTYTWENGVMTAITNGTHITKFFYDGMGRRISTQEWSSGTMTNQTYSIWCGSELCQERSSSFTVNKRFFGQGEQVAGNNYYFTRDHLGSVREMTDSSGTVQARYDYDPYGRQTQVSGTMYADFGYAGMYYHAISGLNLTLFRAYDPNAGRWLNHDPIGERGGLNLYDYVGNNPINLEDHEGLTGSIWGSSGTLTVNGTKVTGINTSDEFFKAITDNSSGDGSITSLDYSGHGDTQGGLYMSGQPGEGLQGWEVANWLKQNAKLFAKNATIKLEACGSANPNKDDKGHRVADAFKSALPDSHVYGFTGLEMFGVGVPNNSYTGKGSPVPNVPQKSIWVEVK
jgi:RHS repeat-associated protein